METKNEAPKIDLVGLLDEQIEIVDQEDLIKKVKYLYGHSQLSLVVTYFLIGAHIGYKKDYGKDVKGRLAAEVGISTSTLDKAIKFSIKFTAAQVKELLSSNDKVVMSWRSIVLSIDVLSAEQILQCYKGAFSVSEFRTRVMKLKGGLSGPSKKLNPKDEDEPQNLKLDGDEAAGESKDQTGGPAPLVKELNQEIVDRDERITMLEKVNEDLRIELQEKEELIKELEFQLELYSEG